jgi:hypothetical protein
VRSVIGLQQRRSAPEEPDRKEHEGEQHEHGDGTIEDDSTATATATATATMATERLGNELVHVFSLSIGMRVCGLRDRTIGAVEAVVAMPEAEIMR